ncbi:MAG: DnaA regulatory inactivator Hda, partial [Gammaproteobacteria bacterium]|nr:DnaA regulatory inactivator Hda [Gammaproteobacteria bacterium]
RLAASLIFEQQVLNDDEKKTALQQRAKMRGLTLSDDVANYLVSRAQRDTHSLFSLLDRLDKFSMVKQRGLTVPLVKEVLFGVR